MRPLALVVHSLVRDDSSCPADVWVVPDSNSNSLAGCNVAEGAQVVAAAVVVEADEREGHPDWDDAGVGGGSCVLAAA